MKRIKVLVMLIVIANQLNAQNPSLIWAKRMGGIISDQANSIVVDTSGNVYTTGHFSNTVDFNPNAGIFNLTALGFGDGFIVKLDSSGNFKWARKIGGPGDDLIESAAVDSLSNLYVTGIFSNTVDFDPSTAVFNLTASGSFDVYIAKFDSAGNFVWAERIDGPVDEKVSTIALDAAMNVYITGAFRLTADFDPGPAVYPLTAGTSGSLPSGAPNTDMYILKLTSSGNFCWAKRIGGNDSTIKPLSMTINTNQNILITGNFLGTIDFNPGAGVYDLKSSSAPYIFVLELDSSAGFVWAKCIGSLTMGAAYPFDITTDANDACYVTGNMFNAGLIDFDPGPGIYPGPTANFENGFLLKLDAYGNFKWAKFTGGYSSEVNPLGIVLDSNKNIYTIGIFDSIADFDPNASIANLNSTDGNGEIFISKLDSLGNYLWAVKMGGSMHDEGYAIALDNKSNIYSTGTFESGADFDPNAGIVTLLSLGYSDVFVHKMNQCPSSTNTISASACDSYVLNGNTYTASGIYTQALTNAFGCDSMLSLYMTMNNSNTNITQTACNSYTYNGQTYTSTGVYVQNYTSSLGCDSIMTLNLVINTSVSSSMTQTACKSFTLNGQIYSSSGTFTQTFVSASGCDSTLTLHLIIDPSPNTLVTQTGATLMANATGVNYQWVLCPANTILPGATNQTYLAPSNGSYAVVIQQASCIDTSNCYSVTNIGVGLSDYVVESNTLQLSPNPSENEIMIQCSNPLHDATLKLINCTGQVVLRQTNLNGKLFSIPISDYANGIYFIEVKEKAMIHRMKIVKN